uniref:Uncharacterized protein n=1 Tax=Rhizophora mucronata TaxID=61149 RepID=A0A2P2N543_RHIMU
MQLHIECWLMGFVNLEILREV